MAVGWSLNKMESHLLHAITNTRKLILEVCAPGLSRVEIRLDRHADAPSDDAIAMTAAQL